MSCTGNEDFEAALGRKTTIILWYYNDRAVVEGQNVPGGNNMLPPKLVDGSGRMRADVLTTKLHPGRIAPATTVTNAPACRTLVQGKNGVLERQVTSINSTCDMRWGCITSCFNHTDHTTHSFGIT